MGMRGRLASAGFRCSQNRGSQAYYDISVPDSYPCCYDQAGKDYHCSNQDVLRSKPQLVKYFEACLALARTGGAYRTEAERDADEDEGARFASAPTLRVNNCSMHAATIACPIRMRM